MISSDLHPLSDPKVCADVCDAAKVWGARARSLRGCDALPEQSVAELRQLDVFSIWQESDVNWPTICEVARLAAQACPSTGWILVNCIGHSLIADRFPAAMSRKIFLPKTAPVIATAMAASDVNMTEHADGSLSISGCFVNSSGIDHADWVLLKLPAGPDGQPRYIPCKTDRITIRRTWNSSGLMSSGTHSFSVDLSVAKDEIAAWEPCLKGHRITNDTQINYLRSVPLVAYLGTSLIAPILGCAEALFREQERLIACRTRNITLETAPVLTALGESAMEIATAQLLYRDLLTWLHNKGSKAEAVSPQDVKICRAKAATLVQLCGTAAKRLQNSCGMAALAEDAPAQGYWRDLQVMSAHSDVRHGISLLEFGRICLDEAKANLTENRSKQYDCA
jgi:3-hydroxy-9,10-secoandrosta-1,3,5(10)-triene-9,17-dione monooxygenase